MASSLSDIAATLGLAYQSVKSRACILRHRHLKGDAVPEIVWGAEKSGETKPAGAETRTVETVVPDYKEPIEELLERAMDYNDRFAAHHRARNIVDLKINVPGPIGVAGLPDHHLNNIGTLLRRAFEDAYLIRDTTGLYAIGIGDWIDNFIVGRLERERRKDIMSHDDSWRVMEAYVEVLAPKLIAAISGNHNDWTASLGGVDYTRKLFEAMGLGAIYDTDEIRVRLNLPNGATFTHLVRHRYRGSSKYNAVHGILVRIVEDWQGEDVFWGGHIHAAGHMSIERAWMGQRRVVHAVQLAAYKDVDSYQRSEAFRHNVPFLVPMVIHDPDTRETHFFEHMRLGVWVLQQMRAERGLL
jgi:hypothetical protein